MNPQNSKPRILTQSKFNPPEEVINAAKWCAVRGLKGNIGDRLPMNMDARAVDWINKNRLSFERYISIQSKPIIGADQDQRDQLTTRLSLRSEK